jgi:V/A-type H+-transporting ATPase subunit K
VSRSAAFNSRFSLVFLFLVFLTFVSVGAVFGQTAVSENPATDRVATVSAEVQKYGLIAAAVAFGLGAIGAGIAIANVGSAAMGAMGEKPEIAGQALIFVALAEGLVVFGFITALMILGKV